MIRRLHKQFYQSVVLVWILLSIASVILAAANWVRLSRQLDANIVLLDIRMPRMAVNESREFARQLEALARRTNCEPLLHYAQVLTHHADTYAVDSLERHLQDFPALIDRVERSGHEI